MFGITTLPIAKESFVDIDIFNARYPVAYEVPFVMFF
jgi:hypothetical protein